MALKEQIDIIIEKRKEKCEKLRARKEKLLFIKSTLREKCDALVLQTKGITDEALRMQYISLFGGINSKIAQRKLDMATKKMDEGIKRFSRDYISIATVGKERQGKSQFLQSVGDLDNEIIPAYDSTSCTGATSIIWNDPNMAKGTVRATINFRQPTEILEFVKSYVSEIDPSYLSEEEIDFDGVSYINISYLEMKIEEGNAKKASAMKHLKSIVENFDDIKDLFGSSPITLTDPNLIKTYVAQNNGLSPENPERENYFSYLAVSRADIYCPFFADVGRIRLVDTVGIGDTKYGIEDAMLETVDRECDAAIVVTRPISGVQTTDQALYNSLRDKFVTRDTKKWLFYLANHYVGQNDKTVTAFAEEICKSNWAVASCRVVDASDQNAVKDNFVVPMLNILVENMNDIDSAYLKEIDDLEAAARAEVRQFIDELPSVKELDIGTMQGKEAYLKGFKCFTKMSAELSNIVYYWSGEKEKYNGILWNHVQSILNSLDSIVPSAEQIQQISDNNGALLGDDVWKTVLHHVRNEITDRFIVIDDVLEKVTMDFKNSMVDVIYEELCSLSPNRENDDDGDEVVDKVEWLKNMTENVLGNNPIYSQIRKAFDFLCKFEFNTRAQIIQEVRRQLYIINPICTEYAKPLINFQKPTCGKMVHFYLTSRMSVIEDELRYHLAKLYRTPNMAFYAAAEEFYDRLTFASDISEDQGSLTGMSEIWGTFFQEYSSELWKEQSDKYKEVNSLINGYNLMIAILLEAISVTED